MKGSEENWYSLLKEGSWIDCKKKHPPPNFAVGVGVAYFGHILKSDHLGALQNVYPFKILERQFSPKWQGPSPLFECTFTKNPLCKMTALLKHQSHLHFEPCGFERKTQKSFVDKNLCFHG